MTVKEWTKLINWSCLKDCIAQSVDIYFGYDGKKILEKEKMLVTIIFSFFHINPLDPFPNDKFYTLPN